jgi:hypothetical protein
MYLSGDEYQWMLSRIRDLERFEAETDERNATISRLQSAIGEAIDRCGDVYESHGETVFDVENILRRAIGR